MNQGEKNRFCCFPFFVGAVVFVAGCGPNDEPAPAADGASGATCVGGSAGTSGSGTGADSGAGGAPDDAPGCVSDGENVLCAPAGFPFVTRTFADTESCTGSACAPPNPTLTQPEAGTLCISGTAPDGGYAGFPLILLLTTPDFGTLLRAFDADARGIIGVSFTIDPLPEGGVMVDAGVVRADCSNTFECVGFGFKLPRIVDPGTTTVPLVDFLQSDARSSYQIFDTSALSHIGFSVGEGPYDFCVRDFKFLDAAGDEIKPE